MISSNVARSVQTVIGHESIDGLLAIRAGQSAGWWWATDELALLELSGNDAGDFLQRRTSNDVSALAVGQGQANTVLERKGELRALFTVQRVADDRWWLVTEASRLQALRHEITRFKIMEQFALSQPEDWRPLCLLGSAWSDIAPWFTVGDPNRIEPLTGGDVQGLNECWLSHRAMLPFGREPLPSWILWVPLDKVEEIQTWLAGLTGAHSMVELYSDTREGYRIEAAVPRFGRDWDETTALPELGLEHWSVSYTKGCYLGQETIAKVRTYGAIGQVWMGLLFNAADRDRIVALPVLEDVTGHPLLLDGKKIGRLTSWGWSDTLQQPVGLAYLGKGTRVPGQGLKVTIAGQPFSATVATLPLVLPSRTTRQKAEQLQQSAMARFVADDSDAAITLLNEALTLDPNYEPALESLGVILRRLDRVDDAIAVFNRLLAVNPEAVMAYTNLSVLALTQGDKEAAETWKAQGTTVAMRVKIRETIAAKSATSTMELASSSLLVEPSPVVPTLTDDQKTLLRERIALFEQALQFSDSDPLAHAGLAGAWLSLSEPALALPSLRRTVELQPGNLKVYAQLGQALATTGQPEAARTVYQKGIERATSRGDSATLLTLQQGLAQLG